MKKFLPFIYAFATNGCSFLISALSTLVIPRFIGITEYGYWQLYMFYVSYVGIFHLGWNDGIYLRYGGKQYDSLDKETLKKTVYCAIVDAFNNCINYIPYKQIYSES